MGRLLDPANAVAVVEVDPTTNEPARFTQVFAYNADGNLEYHGKAAIGSSQAAAVWQIKRFTWSGSTMTKEEWADGNVNFDNVWNDRASLSYA